jgi:hypothetical protein
VKAGDKQSGLHGVISEKIVLFITTAVRTSNMKVPWIDSRHISPELLLFLFSVPLHISLSAV